MIGRNDEKRRTIELGKIAFYGDRRINMADVEIALWKDEKGRPVFSACGEIWNSRHTDVVCGGQCFDELKRYFHANALFQMVEGLWKRNHLNDTNAGTPEQEKALAEGAASGELTGHDYDADCAYLKKHGLYTVTVDGKPYDYGTSWLYRPIDADDLGHIEDLIENGTVTR
jgi:hypothetical protein